MSVLPSVLDQIAADWAALTPPTYPEVAYHEVGGRTDPEGVSGDRAFAFGLPEFETVEGVGPDGDVYRWTVVVGVRLAAEHRTHREVVDAVADETVLLVRAVHERTTWPAGVTGAPIIESAEPAPAEDDSGDVTVFFTFVVETEET